MSDFLAEARVLVRPDTTKFRATLETELASVTKKPIVIPVTAAVTGTATGAGTAVSKSAETAKQAEAAATRFLEKSELALVAAQEKALLTTTQLGAARVRLTGAVAAVRAAEQGLTAAERSKNVELIESAQATLALAEAEEVRARGVARTVVLANAQEAALAKTAAAEAAAAKATVDHSAASLQAAGAERARITATIRSGVEQAKLADIQRISAASANDLAAAQLRVTTAASAVGKAQIEAAAAARVASRQEEILAIAISTGNASLIRAAVLTTVLTKARQEEALAALTAARAEITHASSLGAVEKAALAGGASMLGLRGAVLTASAAFLGATVAFQTIRQSIQEASDATEEFNKTQVVFGKSAEQITNFARTTASELGIASTEALRAAGIFGNLFRSINIGQPAAAAMSEALVRLASDLASFNNADPSQVLENLRSGLVGEPEPLRKFGIFLSQVRAQQEALIETGKKSIDQLTQGEIVQARYNLILQDGSIAAGDFANTQGELANATRTLKAEIQDLQGDLGSALIPTLTDTAGLLTDVAKGFKVAADRARDFKAALPGGDGGGGKGGGGKLGFLTQSLPASLREVTAAFEVLQRQSALTFGELPSTTLRRLNEEANNSAAGVGHLGDALDAGARAARLAAFAIVSANNAIKGLGQSLNALEVAQLEIQTGLSPGGRSAEEANLRQQIEADKQAINAAKSGSAARRKALEELKADQDALAALQAKGVQDAKTNAKDVTSAAQDALKAQEAADQALLDLLGQRRDDAERRISAAGQTEGVADDIRRQDQLQALIKKQIAKVRNLITDEKARKDVIRELRIALIASRKEEEALRQEQKADAAARKQEGIDLDIAFAETTGNVSKEIAARQRLISLLKKQQASVKRGTNEWKQLRNEIAEQQQAIKDAKKQADETKGDGTSAQQFFFEQLQAQRGFASNLMGNLITGPTAGLVGVPAPQTTGPGKGVAVAAAVQEGKAGGGPTSGQANTTINRLDKIIAQLQVLNGQQQNPEAHRQRKEQHATMDYGAGGGASVVM